MPIDLQDQKWPPAECAEAEQFYRPWAAWYSGDPQELSAVYSAGTPSYPMPETRRRGSVRPGGVAGWIQRFWWGKPQDESATVGKLHIPAASDVSALSADMLFGEPPAWIFPDGADKTQARMEAILEDGGCYAKLLEGAEIDSALGGAYVRAFAVTDLADTPMWDVVWPQQAIPEFRYGVLVAVTFWQEVAADADERGAVWRWLERHECINKRGMVYHALFKGTVETLGKRVPLGDHPATAMFAERVDDQGGMETGATLLDVEYIPNIRPHRMMRGSPLGRSDYAGSEGSMDSLDETWSSLMRDIDLGKGRLVVPIEYMRNLGRGKGSTFSTEQSIYEGLDILASKSDSPAQTMQIVQFAIRVDEHLKAAAGLWRAIVRGAGLGAQAFGEESDAGAQTATEASQRGSRQANTRDRKIGYWRPSLRRLTMATLEIDKHVFGTAGVDPQMPMIEWPDAAAVAPNVLAQTLQLLDAAGAISTREKVAMLHPDWKDKAIDAEVDLIEGSPAPDPTEMVPTGNPMQTQPPVAPPAPGVPPKLAAVGG